MNSKVKVILEGLASGTVQEDDAAFQLREIKALRSSHSPLRSANDIESIDTPVPAFVQTPSAQSFSKCSLSKGQEALWIIHQNGSPNTAYNLPLALRLRQDANQERIATALRITIERHPIMGSNVSTDNGQPVLFHSNRQLRIEDLAMSHLTMDELQKRLRRLIRMPFDLKRDALYRIYCITGPERFRLVLFVFHHMIMDGISANLLVSYFVRTYSSLANSQIPPAPEPAVPYSDFVRWQREMLTSPVAAKHREYWVRKLTSDSTTVVDELAYRRRSGWTSNAAECVSIEIDDSTWLGINDLARQEETSPANVLLAALACLLHVYSRRDEIYIAVPTDARPDPSYLQTVGFFVNTLVLRIPTKAEMTCRELLQAVRRDLLESQEHVDYPYVSIIDELRKAGKPNPRFDIAYYFQNEVSAHPGSSDKDCCVEAICPEFMQEGEFEFAVQVITRHPRPVFHFRFNPERFERSSVERLADHYREAVLQIIANSDRKLRSLSFFTRTERELVDHLNRTETEYRKNQTVADLILTQVRRTPAAVALMDGERTLTYEELAALTGLLVERLRRRNLASGSLVGILLARRVELVAAMLSVHSVGCAYVPLDADFPKERLAFIVHDAEISVILTESTLRCQVESLGVDAILLDALQDSAVFGPPPRTPQEASKTSAQDGTTSDTQQSQRNRTAYVIYTSGSTGTPKGVAVSHGSLVNFLVSMAHEPGCSDEDHLLAITTVGFDIASLELFLPLICGGKVEIVPTKIAKDGMRLRERLEASEATIVQATPATLQMLLAAGWSKWLKGKVLCGGEPLNRDLADHLLERADQVWNMYGPTEATIWSSANLVGQAETISIGKPIANTRFYLLNELGDQVPFGAPGELYIAGDGVALGYWNRPQLTVQKFLPDPFHQYGGKMFKTGDCARFLPNGNVEFLGRIDNQIKLRGFRVEPAEIEHTLCRSGLILDAKVLLREDFGEHIGLVAFTTLASPPQPGLAARLDQFVRRWLPDYMVPARLVFLKSFPGTPANKVDAHFLKERSLEEIEGLLGFGQTAEPFGRKATKQNDEVFTQTDNRTALRLQDELRDIAAGIANVVSERISCYRPLGEYGFDSLRFTILSIRLKARYGLAIDTPTFYQHPRLVDLANYLTKHHPEKVDCPTPVSASENVTQLPQVLAAVHGGDSARDPVAPERSRLVPIAIIGVGGKLPGAETLDEFWTHLESQGDLIEPYPDERDFLSRPFFHEQDPDNGSANLYRGAFLSNVANFDAALFQISPREAAQMDPQQRLLLQAAWQALGDAGYAPSQLSKSNTGVFMGVSSADYFSLLKYEVSKMDSHFLTGTAHSIAANRISFAFDLHGPSATFDTACSSSLVAIHRAARALQESTCDMALAGGVNLLLSNYAYIGLKRAGMLSSDGRCRTFDERADGYGRGEGVACLLLKRLDRAQADGDPIRAVIVGAAENHSGRTHALTVPNPEAQSQLLVKAYESAGIPPRSVSYVETHGTGTRVGDPIEVNALKDAFARLYQYWNLKSPDEPHIGLGSVKTNIGHLEAAAGVAGVIKVVLSMKHRMLPGLVHFSQQNRMIDLAGSPFYIQTKTVPWTTILDEANNPYPRRAGVSSFGMGGSSVHLVLEEPPADGIHG